MLRSFRFCLGILVAATASGLIYIMWNRISKRGGCIKESATRPGECYFVFPEYIGAIVSRNTKTYEGMVRRF